MSLGMSWLARDDHDFYVENMKAGNVGVDDDGIGVARQSPQ